MLSDSWRNIKSEECVCACEPCARYLSLDILRINIILTYSWIQPTPAVQQYSRLHFYENQSNQSNSPVEKNNSERVRVFFWSSSKNQIKPVNFIIGIKQISISALWWNKYQFSFRELWSLSADIKIWFKKNINQFWSSISKCRFYRYNKMSLYETLRHGWLLVQTCSNTSRVELR